MSGKTKGAADAAPSATEEIDELTTLKAKLAGVEADYAELEKVAANQKKALELATSEAEDAKEIIADLKDQLKEAGTTAKGPIGKVGNDKYRVVGGFRTKEKVFTPSDIAADAKVLKALVDKGSSLVQKL